MRTDRQMFALFSDAVIDEPADPTFLDELFEVLVDEVRTTGLAATAVPRGGLRPTRGPRRLVAKPRSFPAWAAQVAAVLLLVAVAVGVVIRSPQVGPSPTPFPPLSTTFTSPLGGYSIGFAAGARVIPATQAAAPGLHTWQPDDPWVDAIRGPGDLGNWDIVSEAIPAGTSVEQWLADERAAALLGGSNFPDCASAMTEEPVVIDGVAGYIDTHCSTISLMAVVASGSRGYVFDMFANPPNMAWFRAMLATIRLNPAAGATPTPGPTLPTQPAATLTTFSSKQYGYSLGYPSNWKVRPATGALDPGTYPYDFSAGTDYFGANAPDVADPGLIAAAPTVAPGTTLSALTTSAIDLQRTTLSCDPPQSTETITVAGLPGSLLTWPSCPQYLLWAVVVRGNVGYELLWIDQYATNNPPQQAADRAMFLRILGTFQLPKTP